MKTGFQTYVVNPVQVAVGICKDTTSGQYVVPNPMSKLNGGPIDPGVGVLGAATIEQAYLWKPAPQYQYMTADSPTIGFTFYQALQVMAQKRFGSGGILSAAYTLSNMIGTADDLNAWLEGSRYDVGGGEGVQDNDNIRGNATNPGEFSKSSFTVPNRLVINYVYPLPFGQGKRFLSNASGVVNKLVGDWTVNGLSTFQDGFPLGFQDSSTNALESQFAAGYAGPGLLAGVTRPNYVAGCNRQVSGKPSQKINGWFNNACFQAPNVANSTTWTFGDEPRVDPVLRSQGIDSTDFSVSKAIPLTERLQAGFQS